MIRLAVTALAGLAATPLLGCDAPKKETSDRRTEAPRATAAPIDSIETKVSPDAGKRKKPRKKAADCPKGAYVTFDNPDVEAEVRYKLRKKKGKISKAELAKVKSINLSQKRTDELDVCVFPLFKNLRSLYLGRGGLDDLSPIAGLTKLRNLRASLNMVSNLKPLANMTEMDRLDLGQTQVEDLTPLSSMKKLTDLQLDDTKVEDISPLAGLTNLEQLSLQRTRVNDLSPLKGMKNLKFLRIKGVGADTFVLMPLVGGGLEIIED